MTGNLEIARKFIESTAQRNTAEWNALVNDDLVWNLPFMPDGIPARWEGRATCEASLLELGQLLEASQVHDVRLIERGEYVFGTMRSEGRSVKGREYRNDYFLLFRFDSGRISEYHEYFNPLKLLDAFGAEIAEHAAAHEG